MQQCKNVKCNISKSRKSPLPLPFDYRQTFQLGRKFSKAFSPNRRKVIVPKGASIKATFLHYIMRSNEDSLRRKGCASDMITTQQLLTLYKGNKMYDTRYFTCKTQKSQINRLRYKYFSIPLHRKRYNSGNINNE